MADDQIVTEIILDARQAQAGGEAYTETLDGVGAATEKVINETEALNRSFNSAGIAIKQGATSSASAVDRLLQSMDAAYKTSRQLEQGQAQLAQALDAVDKLYTQGRITQADAANRTMILANAQRQLTGVQAQLASGALTAAEAQREITAVFNSGAVATSRLRVEEEVATKSHGKLTSARMEGQHVAKALFDSYAAGIPITQALMAETGRLADIATRLPMSWLAMAGIATAVIAPLALLAAAAYSAGQRMEETQRILALNGSYTGLTATAFTALADNTAKTANISKSSALSLQQTYVATGTIGTGVLGRLTSITQQWARATGQSADDASKQLAELFSDPARGRKS